MSKNISSYEIRTKRSNLIKKQEESGKSIHEMIDEIEGKIYNLKEEKEDLTDKKIPYYENEIKDVDKKLKEKAYEKMNCANAWLSYIGILEGDKSIKKIIHVSLGVLCTLVAGMTLITTKNLLAIPVMFGAFAVLDILFLAINKSDIKKEIKTLKVRHFGRENITEEEMQEIVKAKEKEIDPELDKLNETRRNLINVQQKTYQRIDKISKGQEELEIDRKILIQEAIRNADKEEYIEDYLNDQIKEYYNLTSKQSLSSEEKPKVQSKRLKADGKEN